MKYPRPFNNNTPKRGNFTTPRLLSASTFSGGSIPSKREPIQLERQPSVASPSRHFAISHQRSMLRGGEKQLSGANHTKNTETYGTVQHTTEHPLVNALAAACHHRSRCRRRCDRSSGSNSLVELPPRRARSGSETNQWSRILVNPGN